MQNSLSIRSYTKQSRTHLHDYHQLVLPTQGVIQIEIPTYQGNVAVGECVVIRKGQEHHFRADEAARFVVADMTDLPDNLAASMEQVFATNAPLQSFLMFVEKQLAHQVHPSIEATLFSLFTQLLNEQNLNVHMDLRIRRAQAYILDHLAEPLSITYLADIAHLSPTQFKKLFKENTHLSPLNYITEQRMERAKALLIHSDNPIRLVAEQVGYTDFSAFSRRFKQHFGMSPSALSVAH